MKNYNLGFSFKEFLKKKNYQNPKQINLLEIFKFKGISI